MRVNPSDATGLGVLFFYLVDQAMNIYLYRFLIAGLTVLGLGSFGSCGGGGGDDAAVPDAAVVKARVQTWYHPNGEANATTAVASANVRSSTVYRVRVAPVTQPDKAQDSFVYMSIPRSGLGKVGYTGEDGAEFSAQAGMTMSWSSFLHDEDVWVYVELVDGPALTSADEVTIRPTPLTFRKELVNEKTVRIRVPRVPEGFRFSVEFDSQQITIYEGPDRNLTTEPAGNPAVHTEPRNGLMIFAEPMVAGREAEQLTPDSQSTSYSIHYPAEGLIPNLNEVTDRVIYFRPGTYYMGANYHADLHPNVRWVYLAPGAYVKGAFQFHASPPAAFPELAVMGVTGFGVLSGEQYVYEADRANGYQSLAADTRDCFGTCVKLLEFESSPSFERMTIHGITLANAPYHSFVIYGAPTIVANISHGKQVGGWYFQTDGYEMYDNFTMSDMFFHLNDDVIKLYGSNTRVERIVAWKLENGPVIQWGWSPRNIGQMLVNGVDVIHNRMHRDDHNTCIVNSAKHFLDPDSNFFADPQAFVSDIGLSNIRSEGMNLCAMRLYALSSWRNIHIENLWIEEWNGLDIARQASRFTALSNAAGVAVSIGNELREQQGLSILNYTVAGERITRAAGNWRADELGRLDFDPALSESWNAE